MGTENLPSNFVASSHVIIMLLLLGLRELLDYSNNTNYRLSSSGRNRASCKIPDLLILSMGWWCWRRLLRVPWIARRSNQSMLKEINPEYSLKRLMLKLQYFGHLMQRADSLEKTLMLGKIEDRRRRGRQMMRWLDSITDSTDMTLSNLR